MQAIVIACMAITNTNTSEKVIITIANTNTITYYPSLENYALKIRNFQKNV